MGFIYERHNWQDRSQLWCHSRDCCMNHGIKFTKKKYTKSRMCGLWWKLLFHSQMQATMGNQCYIYNTLEHWSSKSLQRLSYCGSSAGHFDSSAGHLEHVGGPLADTAAEFRTACAADLVIDRREGTLWEMLVGCLWRRDNRPRESSYRGKLLYWCLNTWGNDDG